MDLVTGVIGRLLLKLGKLLKDEYDVQTGVRKKIELLTRELESVHAVLRNAGEVPPDQLGEHVRLWARDLREASYDMEDVVDAFLVRVDGPDRPAADLGTLRRLRKKVSKLFKQAKARRKIDGAIQDITEKLQEVAARHGRYTVHDIPKPVVPATVDPRLVNLYKTASKLVGIEGQMEKLINMMTLGNDIDDMSSDNKTMKMVSIVGIGGLGKTTLAKAVYDRFKFDFDCGAFVPVGQLPNVKKVLRDILIGLDKRTYMNSNITLLDERQLIDELHEFLQNKRCFIVIDDLWDKKSWGLIRCALQDSNCGSRVVATTRIFEVATFVGNVYEMKPLSHDDSRKLLYARIIDGEGESLVSPSAKVCDKILKKCGGVPLAIITIASLLANKPGEYWTKVYNSIGKGHGGNGDVENTRQILSLSFYDLPLHLKPCLLYLSIFPEDYYIEKNMLIWNWIAEGFVHEEQNIGIGLFELGEGYFNELVNRSMIQSMENENRRHVDGCRVHDMVLDLIRLMSAKENFVTIMDGNEHHELSWNNARRLALQHWSIEKNGHELSNIGLDKLRSFIMSECYNISVAFPSFKVLRVFAIHNPISWSHHSKLCLQHIGGLIHLRYLGLRHIRSNSLPEEVGYLKFLQVLDLSGSKIRELPESVSQLTKLLCLRADTHIRVSPSLIGKLTSLQELWIWPYRADICEFAKVLGKLRELRVLRTGFFYRNCNFVGPPQLRKTMHRDLLVSLCNLHKIQTVDFFGYLGRMHMTIMSEEEFTFPQQLRFLGLCWTFHRIPMWINSSVLPYLCHLVLRVQMLKVHDMEVLGRLPELRFLQLLGDHTEIVSAKKTDGDGYFRKLRICNTTFMFLWFDLDAVMCNKKSLMPNLESLNFLVDVWALKDASVLGFESLLSLAHLGRTSLQIVEAQICCNAVHATYVEEAEAALAHAAAIHPNHPTLITARTHEGMMLSSDKEPSRKTPNNVIVKDVNLRRMIDVECLFDYHWLLLLDPRVEKFCISINCEDAMLEEVEEAEEAVRSAVDDHPNHPTLEMVRHHEDRMVMFDQSQEPEVVHRCIHARTTMDPDYAPIIRSNLRFGGRFDWLSRNPYLEKFIISIDCENASLEEVEKTEADAKEAIKYHCNRPTLELMRCNEDKMVLSGEQCQQPSSVNPKVVVEHVHVREMKEIDDYFDFHWLLRNPRVEELRITINCKDAMLEEVEEAEAAVRRAVDDHPNHPTLNMVRHCQSMMVIFDRSKEPEVVHRCVHARVWAVDGYGMFFWLMNHQYVQKFSVSIDCEDASVDQVEETEEAARNIVDRHPNRPTLELTRYNEDKMEVFSDAEA